MSINSICDFLEPFTTTKAGIDNFLTPVRNPESLLSDFKSFQKWALWFLNNYNNEFTSSGTNARCLSMVLFQSMMVKFGCMKHDSSIPMDIFRDEERYLTDMVNPVSYVYFSMFNNFCPKSYSFRDKVSKHPHILEQSKKNMAIFSSVLQELGVLPNGVLLVQSADDWVSTYMTNGKLIAVPRFLDDNYHIIDRVIKRDRAAAQDNRDYYRDHKDDHYGKSIRESVKRSAERKKLKKEFGL